MPMQGEKFDPHDPEYEKVSDLPKEQQGKYVNINGGFVTKEAADIEKTYAEAAAEENKKIPFYKKPFLEKNEKATAEDMILDELTSDLKDIEGKYYAGYLRRHLGLNLSDLEKKVEHLNSLDTTTRRQVVESLIREALGKREKKLGYPIPDDFHVQLHEENFNFGSPFRMYEGDKISGTFNGHKLVLERSRHALDEFSASPAVINFHEKGIHDATQKDDVPKVRFSEIDKCIIGSIDGKPLNREEAARLWVKYYDVAHDSLLDINRLTENVLDVIKTKRYWDEKEIKSRVPRIGVKKALKDL